MAFSWQESVKTAGTQDIQCDIEYLDKSYIHVYLDGSETTAFTWTSSTNIRLNSPLSTETVVLLIRKTEREYLYIEFASGAPFIEGNVDTQNTQFLHLAQELVEGRYIEGFYGDINMHRYRITNLGDPVDARDASNKQYVDAGDARLDRRIDAEHTAWVSAVENEASIRKAADDALDVRTTNLEQTAFNANTNSFPWWTIVPADTTTITPGMPFTRAKIRLNGVTQTAGYSYSISNGVVTFAEVVPAGTLVDMTIGIDTEADTGVVASLLALLSGKDGATYIGYGLGYAVTSTLKRVVSRIKTLFDYGETNTYLGYNPAADAQVYADRDSDGELMLPGSLHIAKDVFGIRRHALGLGVVINKGASGFNNQVTGVSGSLALSTYNSADDVSINIEAYSEAYTDAENLATTTGYTATSFSAEGIDFSKLKVGMICRTKHSAPYWAIITGWHEPSNTVYVDAFARSGVAYTPESDGSGIYINYKSKIWAANITSTLDPDSKAERMTSIEVGFQNKKLTNPTDSNGIDVVSLGNYRGTAAFYGRNNKDGNNWRNIFRGSGATEGTFVATNSTYGTVSPYGYVNSTATGFVSYGDSVVFHSAVRRGGLTGALLSGQNGTGAWLRNPTLLTVANNSYTISANAGSVLHNSTDTGHVYTLPSDALVNEDIKVYNPPRGASLTISTPDGSATIVRPDGSTAASLTVYGNQSLRFRYTGALWFVMGIQDNPVRATGTLVTAATTVAAGATVLKTLAVPGAALGMFVEVSCSENPLGLILTGYVDSPGSVTFAISNISGASVSLPASNLRAKVMYSEAYS